MVSINFTYHSLLYALKKNLKITSNFILNVVSSYKYKFSFDIAERCSSLTLEIQQLIKNQ